MESVHFSTWARGVLAGTLTMQLLPPKHSQALKTSSLCGLIKNPGRICEKAHRINVPRSDTSVIQFVKAPEIKWRNSGGKKNLPAELKKKTQKNKTTKSKRSEMCSINKMYSVASLCDATEYILCTRGLYLHAVSSPAVIQSREPGWLEGELEGKRGLIPENYVEML